MQSPDLVDYLHKPRLSDAASLLSYIFYCKCQRASARERGSCSVFWLGMLRLRCSLPEQQLVHYLV